MNFDQLNFQLRLLYPSLVNLVTLSFLSITMLCMSVVT